MSLTAVSYEFTICQRCGKYKRTMESQKWITDAERCSCPPETTAVTPYAQGWVCPKCGRVNAPWVSCCPCWTPQTFSVNTSATITYPDGLQFTPTTGGHVSKRE
jgi:hypothetical protein